MLGDSLPQLRVAQAVRVMGESLIKSRSGCRFYSRRDIEVRLAHLQMDDIDSQGSISRALSRTSMTMKGDMLSALLDIIGLSF